MLLERLPGPPFRDKQQMYAWASKLGVKRALRSPAPAADDDANAPEGDKPTLRGSRAMPIKRDVESDTKSQVSARPKAGAAPTRKAPGPLDTRDGSPSIAARRLLEESWHNSVSEVSWHDAMTWAHRNGVQLGGTEEADLVATNARRDELHLPRFAIVQARGKPEGLPDPRLTIATAA